MVKYFSCQTLTWYLLAYDTMHFSHVGNSKCTLNQKTLSRFGIFLLGRFEVLYKIFFYTYCCCWTTNYQRLKSGNPILKRKNNKTG